MKTIALLLIVLGSVNCKIKIEVTSDKNDIDISYSGSDVTVVTDSNIEEFGLSKKKIQEALRNHYGRVPNEIYLKSPTPYNNLFKTYHWGQISRVFSIKLAQIKNNKQSETVILSHDFENFSNRTVKVNTGLSQSVENSITTTWSKSKEISVSQEVEYNVNFVFAKTSGTTGISFITTVGKDKEISESITIGTTSGMEAELKPYQTVTAVLTAKRRVLEIEVTYLATLRGNLAVNFKKPYKGHHFWGPPIENVMKSGNLRNFIHLVETVKIGTYTDASLKVYDKISGSTSV